MRPPTPFRASAAVALLATFLVGCAPEYNGGEPPNGPQDPSIYLSHPVDEILIRIEGCRVETDTIHIEVRPWEAHVIIGRPFSWRIEGDMEWIRITHREGEPRLPQLPDAEPGGSIEVEGLEGRPGSRIHYDIIAQCGDRIIDIDPDIVLREPT